MVSRSARERRVDAIETGLVMKIGNKRYHKRGEDGAYEDCPK